MTRLIDNFIYDTNDYACVTLGEFVQLRLQCLVTFCF